MKKLNQLRAVTKVFVTTLLLLATQQVLMSQIVPVPIAGNLYGQPIVACNYQDGYRYVATGSAIYASSGAEGSYYFKVFSVPVGYTIVNTFVAHYYWGNMRSVLLRDNQGSYYMNSNRINTPSADNVFANLIQLPGFFTPFTKIAAQGNNIYALTHSVGCGVQGSLYVSRNQGQTWELDTVGVGYNVVFDFALDSSGNLFTVCSAGVYQEWASDTSTATLLNFTGSTPSNIFIDRLNRIIVAATSFSYSPIDMAYVSSDGGITFTTDPALKGSFNFFADDAFGNLYALGTDSNENLTLAQMNVAGIWTTVNSNLSAAIGVSQINCFAGDSLLVVGTSTGLFTSADQGATFTATNQGVLAENIYSIIQQPFGRLFCTTDLGVFYKDQVDSVWHQTYSIPGSNAGMLLFNDVQGNIFVQQSAPMNAYESPAPMAKSADNGVSWTQDGAGLNNIDGLSFYIDETGAQHFYSTQQFNENALNIWTQQMGDTTWNIDNAGLFADAELGYGVNVVYGDGQGYLYADLYTNWGNYMYRRPVHGNQWVCDSVGLSLGQRVVSMTSSPEFGIIAAIGGITFGSYSTLFHRAENGWVQIPTRNDSTNISAVSVDANGVIFVTEPTVGMTDNSATYYTSDGGATWSAANLTGITMQGSNTFMTGKPVQGGLISIGNITYALTQGNWGFAFTSTKTATGIKVTATALNDMQVFPNPSKNGLWNLKTTDEMVDGQMQVTDMNGRVVYRGILQTATSAINLPGLASGIYVLNITNAGKSASNLLVKQ